MNRTTKTAIGWVAVFVVIAVIVLGGNYLIYTYIGMWNYIAVSILSGIVWGWITHRSLKSHDTDMRIMAEVFNDPKNKELVKHLKAFRDV